MKGAFRPGRNSSLSGQSEPAGNGRARLVLEDQITTLVIDAFEGNPERGINRFPDPGQPTIDNGA